jgi:hypothetical protein
MCLILDTHIIHKVFPLPSADFEPIHRALLGGTAKCVYGGGLTREYQQMVRFRRLLLRLDQQGVAKQFPDLEVDSAEEKLRQRGLCKSNDLHVVALAVVSKARLLCSEDAVLGDDFTNPAILSNPRGSIYKRAEHAHLIQKHCG